MYKGILFALATALLFGLANPLGKSFQNSDPIWIAAIISLLAAAIVFLIILVKTGKMPKLDMRNLKWYFAAGVLGCAIPLALMMAAFQLTTSASVGFLVRAEVLFALLYGAWLFHERTSSTQKAGLVLGVMGALIFATNFSINIMPGELAAIAAAAFYATYLVAAKKLENQHTEPLDMTFIRVSFSAIFLLAIIALGFGHAQQLGNWEQTSVVLFALTSFVAGAIAYNEAIKRLQIWRASAIVQFGSGIISVAAGILFLGESISQFQMIGAGLMLLGGLVALESRHVFNQKK